MLNKEHLSKLATALSGEIELYNDIVSVSDQMVTERKKLEEELSSAKEKISGLEDTRSKLNDQIQNLISKVPIMENMSGGTIRDAEERFKNFTI